MKSPAEQILADYLECRDYLHAWQPYNVDIVGTGRNREYRRTLRCGRCKVKRTQVLDYEGRLTGRGGYDYSEAASYLVTGHGRLTASDRAAVRMRSLGERYDLK